MDRKKIDSLSEFQDIPAAEMTPETEVERKDVGDGTKNEPVRKSASEPFEIVRTNADNDVQMQAKKPMKTARQNFRFTEELALALEKCSEDRRLKKNTVVEIALEQYLKDEGYLNL